MRFFSWIGLALIAAALTAGPISAREGDECSMVILTVTGTDISASFSVEELEELGTQTIATSTIWSEGVQEFTGLPLITLLEYLGVSEGTLVAQAINDYSVEIPVSDAVEDGPLLAIHRNGEAMSIRDKGPIWLVYPYDLNAKYRSEIIYSRSIWQLDRIQIQP